MSISVAIIARNSEDCIERCLESVKDADEIIVVDTGSETDATKEIARKYTDKVYDYWGCNEGGKRDGLFMHFSDARNHALRYCKMTHVLTIDTDEVLQEGAMDTFQQFNGQAISVVCESGVTGEQHRQPRVYRNDPLVRWHGRAHNYLKIGPGIHSDLKIMYYPNHQKKRDPDRTMRILEKDIKEREDNAREMYYLAKEYHRRKWFEKAMKMFEQYIKKSKNLKERADAYMLLSRCYAANKRFNDSVNAAMAAVNMNPMCSEALELAGDLSGDTTRLRWKYLAAHATNEGVLFIRPNRRAKVTVLTPYDKDGSVYDFTREVKNKTGGRIDCEAITIIDGNNVNKMTGPCVDRIGYEVVAWRIRDSHIVHLVGDCKDYFPNIINGKADIKGLLVIDDDLTDIDRWIQLYHENYTGKVLGKH